MPNRLLVLVALLTVAAAGQSATAEPVPVPDHLPRYDLTITLDTAHRQVTFRQVVTWKNRHNRPSDTLTFNFYPHYRIPAGESLLLAKTLELLRQNPSYGIEPQGQHGRIERVYIGNPGADAPQQHLTFGYGDQNPTTLVVQLPRPVGCGESVTVVLEGTICLPAKQGRWGQWEGITFVTNALPVLAYYDEAGWHTPPFVAWHQPFWNEAGIYTATITLPTAQVLACSARVASATDLGDGWKRVVTVPFVGRDFAILSSAEYREFCTTARVAGGREILVRCLAHGQHEFYAREMLRYACDALAAYSEWFGPYPYDQFTIAESFFPWNGNECAGLIMIDERVFGMPKLARGYVEYLISHETCHQWWYNQVGTNGYSETFMDEGAATYFAHRLLDVKRGKDNPFLEWPRGFRWLPNIYRDDYRWASFYGAVRRNEAPAAAMGLKEFRHLVRLFSGAYDRGSKVFGMIEERLGPEFLPFMQGIVKKYSFRQLSAAEFKAELIAFTGPQTAPQWEQFFARWVYGDQLTDWAIDSVRIDGRRVPRIRRLERLASVGGPVRVEVVVSQHRELDEPTTLGFQFAEGDGFPVRIPLGPAVPAHYPELDAEVVPCGERRALVRVTLQSAPTQVVVDPDRILLDANPANNAWRRPPRVKVVPLYTVLNETDLTNAHDLWNVNAGIWFWGPLYQDPWYTRSTMLGARAALYRTQMFTGGAYVAGRWDYRDLVAGVDGLIDHWPFPKSQIGFNYERRIGGPYGNIQGADSAERTVIYARYVLQNSSSLYLPPMAYVEAFTSYQDNFLPFARTWGDGAIRPGWTQLNGLHFRLNLYTPYWDPERGIWVDLVAAGGVADLGPDRGTAQLRAEVAMARKLPEGLGYLSKVKLAGRFVGMTATPDEGQFFALGGANLFRGFPLNERQGSALWVANAEVRVPIVQDVRWNVLDNLAGGRGVMVAGFYDVGNVYVNDRSVGGVAHAAGVGLRLDLAFFSFIERATVRFDVGKTLNAATPWQFWFGVQHPF